MFGIRPDLNGLTVSPSEYMPFANAEISLKVKNSVIRLRYENIGAGKRTFTVNGEKTDRALYLSNDRLTETLDVVVTD